MYDLFCIMLQCLRLLPHCPVSHYWRFTFYRGFGLKQGGRKKKTKKTFNISHINSDSGKPVGNYTLTLQTYTPGDPTGWTHYVAIIICNQYVSRPIFKTKCSNRKRRRDEKEILFLTKFTACTLLLIHGSSTFHH